MKAKALIVVSDSNPHGISHRLIAPTIKLLYIKKGIDCIVIDLHKDGFDPMAPKNDMINAINRSYKHLVKTSTHIHFVTSIYFGGISPGIEGFFEQVLTDGFAYDYSYGKYKSRILTKKVFFYLNHIKISKNKFNTAWLRLKFGVIPLLFGKNYIFQSDLSWGNKDVKAKGINKIRNKLIKIIA